MPNRSAPARRLAALAGACLAAGTLGAAGDLRAAAPPPSDGAAETSTSAVAGPSWRKHLGLLYSESAMGRVGRYGPDQPATAPAIAPPPPARRVEGDFLLSGADLFRYNCQSCHTSGGTGEPPEINSMIGPVQSTSRAMIRKRLEARGLPVDAAQVAELAAQGETAIRDRLLKGGQKMPAFPHLQPAEVNALLGYLHQLVGDPDAPRELGTMREPIARVGQHIVKGTCHICHDAQGPDTIGAEPLPSSETPIPSLAAVSRQRTFADLVRKVREGLSGHGAETVHGKMPVLSYLTEDEIAAAQCFLLAYPPRP